LGYRFVAVFEYSELDWATRPGVLVCGVLEPSGLGWNDGAKGGGCGFRSDVALGGAEELEADHEFADGGGAEERREEVEVEGPFGVGLVVRGSRVEAHGVGEGRVEDAVVAGGELLEDGGETGLLRGGEGLEGRDAGAGEDDGFEGPDGPEGDDGDPGGVFSHDAGLLLQLEGEVIGEEWGGVGGEVVLLGGELEGWLVGDVLGGPDLAVGVRVGGAHHGAAVFEDLHVTDIGTGTELFSLLGPHGDDVFDRGEVHGGEGKVVAGGEAEDAAGAGFGFGAEEAGGFDVEGGGGDIGLEGGEVVFEDEGAGVVGGDVAAGAGVAGAEVAGGVVGEGGGYGGGFGLALPGALGAMRGDENPLAFERVPTAVGGLEEEGIEHS
jgi:hypothetical protein